MDHLAPTSYFPDLEHAVFFQHNVETVIWRRRAQHSANALSRWYNGIQARRMYEYEGRVSRAAGHIVAVSETDAREMRELFHVKQISVIPTGVNLEYFQRPEATAESDDGSGLCRVHGLDAQCRWRVMVRARSPAYHPAAPRGVQPDDCRAPAPAGDSPFGGGRPTHSGDGDGCRT